MDKTSGTEICWIRLICFLLSALLAIYFGFFAFSGSQAIQVVKHGGYWLMLLTCALLLICFLRILLHRGNHLSLKPAPILFVIALSAVLWGMQPGGFKILMDEPVLAATSLQMHEEKEVMTVARAYVIEDEVYLLDAYLDKRPYFYPFLVSLLHDATGYRALQGAWLNLLLTPLLLGLIYSIASKLGGQVCGYFSVGLFVTVPLVAMNVNGAGFDILNSVMLLAVIRTAIHYHEYRGERTINVLLLLTVLLVQTRYESALYVLPVSILILVHWWWTRRIGLTKIMILVPLLLVMVPLQHGVLTIESPELWQLKGDAEVPFSIAYIPNNLQSAWNYFFSFKVEQANSLLLSALFLPALIAVPFITKRTTFLQGDCFANKLPVLVFSVSICGSFFLLMTYNWGQLDDIIATRIALPFIMLQTLTVGVVFTYYSAAKWWRLLGFLSCLVFFFGVTLQKTRKTDFLNRSPISDQATWLQSKVREYRKNGPLFVSDLHMIPLVEKVSTLASFRAPARKTQIEFHHRMETFGDILFFYMLEESDSGEMAPPLEITDNFDLEVLEAAEMATGRPVHLARLRRVKFSPEEDFRLHAVMPDPVQQPDAYFEFFAKSLP